MAADTVILVLPAGKSGHMELGLAIGAGKKTHILLDKDYERWDVMYALADSVWDDLVTMRAELQVSNLGAEYDEAFQRIDSQRTSQEYREEMLFKKYHAPTLAQTIDWSKAL